MRHPAPRAHGALIFGAQVCAALAVAACGGRDDGPPRGGDRDTDSTPLVGGPCTYEPIAFRGTVDSILPGGALLVRTDTMPTAGALCTLVQDTTTGRWRVPAPRTGPRPNPGDSVEVAGEVIVTGTCVPCSLRTRVLPAGGG